MKSKVVAYITRGHRLLAFEHDGVPEAGLQVPAGTVEPGEALEDALWREVLEESGLGRAALTLQRWIAEIPQPAYNAVRHYAWLTQVTIEWVATEQPARDYSTVVFASDQDLREITAPDQIVAQSDSRAPVYGWHPTTTWRPGESIREDHALSWPADRELRTLVIGAYTQEADGTFTTLGRTAWSQQDHVWLLVN